MTLSNQMITALSKFTLKARKGLGAIKVADMVNDPRYACHLLIQATLSDDAELIALTKTINNELNIERALLTALEAYVKTLQSQQKSDEFIHESKYYLIKLAQQVYGIAINGLAYREAVKAFLAQIDKNDKPFCLNLARSFYRYWRSANEALADVDQAAINEAQKEALLAIWNDIDEAFLSSQEEWQLSLYTNAMRKIAVPAREVDIRQKIAKLVLVKLRQYSHTEESYRLTINCVQPLFSRSDMQEYFLVVSREFYHFWTERQPLLAV